MDELDSIIRQINEEFGEGTITTASEMPRPERALEKQAIDDFMDRNPMAGGGMLVQPSADGSRPGYGGPGSGAKKGQGQFLTKEDKKKYQKEYYEKNKKLTDTGKQKIENKKALENFLKNKKEIKQSVLLDFFTKRNYADPAKQVSAIRNARPNLKIIKDIQKKSENKGKVTYYTDAELKVANKYASILNNRSKKDKFYVSSNKYMNLTDKEKSRINAIMRNNDYKFNPEFSQRMVKISDKDITKITDNFELPKGVKWNFNEFKYGVDPIKYRNLSSRIARTLSDKKKYTAAYDFSTPQGWMMGSMERVYKNEIKAKVKPKDLTYVPKFNDKGIIVGFTDNTAAGGGNTYYGLNKYAEDDSTAWRAHGDFNRVQKFLNIADGVKEEPGKLLTKILNDKGINIKGLTLNDVLSHQRFFTKLSDTKPTELIKRQIVLHHTKGTGVGDTIAQAAATKDIQLLTAANNLEIRKLEKTARNRKLNFDEIEKLKNYGAKITDFDGKIVGGGFIDPKRQYANIEKEALEYAKGDQFNVKTVASYLERLGCGKAAGGRVFYNEGAFGLTKCAEKGRLKLENIVTKGASNADDAILARTILKAGGGLKSAFALRNIFGPAAIAATVAFEGGLIGYDMLTSGKTLREAFGDNLLNYALGKDYQIDPQEELFKRFKGLGYNNQQIGSIKRSLDAMNTINTGAQLAMDVGQQQEALKKSRGQPQPFMGPDDQMMADTAGQRAEQNLKDAKNQLAEFNRDLVRSGQQDELSRYIESGDYAKGFDLFEQAQKEADIQKLESTLPTAFGKVFPKFEQSRQEDLANLRSVINPAFNIPGARDATFIPGKTTGGLFGLAEGGRAGYKLGKGVKIKPSKVRSDAKSIIDENIKLMKQMKKTGEIDEISSDLNQVIKKALDEDLFDKKDRIVETLNFKAAKERKNFPYNQQVFEEPKDLNFYDAITKSNFRTKTGPFFDYQKRKNKAGGGLLKQAGDRSGPPPESGPNSQGLQGLLNRGKNI